MISKYGDASKSRGEILFNKRDYKGAIDNFSEALNMNPDIEESRIWLAAA